MAAKRSNPSTSGGSPKPRPAWLLPLVLAAITWLTLSTCLNNQLTNWDDASYITLNPLIKDNSWEGIKAIFTTPVMGNYHPITILSYLIEYSVTGSEPWLYHFDSLLLHVLVTLLVYAFSRLLFHRDAPAFITALLFGLHPMHMESVAWISGRKDELCAIFFLLSCISYIRYNRSSPPKKKLWYSAVLLCFVLAVLSKPVAVTLPVVLLLIDRFENRKFSLSVLAEKAPHVVVALFFGILSVSTQHTSGAVNSLNVHFSIIERIALGCYACCTYLLKAVIPYGLRCFYPYPPTAAGSLPAFYYLYIPVTAALLVLLWMAGRKNKTLLFGFLFFIANILLLLQFIPVGNALIAERYTYIPYIGLFFIVGDLLGRYLQGALLTRPSFPLILFIAYMAGLTFVARQRCTTWHDSISLWTDEISKEPLHAPVAYSNLAYIYFDQWHNATSKDDRQTGMDSAFYLMHRSTELWPDSADAYQPLAMIFLERKLPDSADYYFRRSLALKPSPEGFANYGNLLVMIGKPDSAIRQYDKAISQNPDLYAPYLNRGKILRKQNRIDEAMKDFNAAAALNPKAGAIYYERSFCDTQLLSKAYALRDVEQAISLGYSKIDSGYLYWLRK